MFRSSSEVHMLSEFVLLAIDVIETNNDASRGARSPPRTSRIEPSPPTRGNRLVRLERKRLWECTRMDMSRRGEVAASPQAVRAPRRGRTIPCGQQRGSSRESPGSEESLRQPAPPGGETGTGARRPYARFVRKPSGLGRGLFETEEPQRAAADDARLRLLLSGQHHIRGIAPRRMKSPSVDDLFAAVSENSPLTDCSHQSSKSFRNNFRALRALCAGC